MAGWVFVATFLLGAWERGTPDWDWFAGMVKTGGQASIGLAVLAAIVGVSGPPAFGFVLERIVSSLISPSKWQMWNYDGVKKTRCLFPNSSGSAVFHVEFYTKADEKLVKWTQRRRANFYSSVTASLSVWLGLGVIAIRSHAVPLMTFAGGLALSVRLLAHAGRVGRYHREVIEGWIAMNLAEKPIEQGAAPNSRSPSQLPTSSGIQSSGSQRTAPSGGCG
jgi:hypothetical protein